MDIGEDLELVRYPEVIAVALDSVRDGSLDLSGFIDTFANLLGGERGNHFMLGRHAANPAIGLDTHRFSSPFHSVELLLKITVLEPAPHPKL